MRINEVVEGIQPRVRTGNYAQGIVIEHLKQLYGDDFELVSTAKASSNAPDIVAMINGKKTQLEIKGRRTPGGTVKIYEARIKRGGRDRLFDAFARAHSNGKARTFEQYIDLLRETNPAIGFPGDEGVTAKAGKFHIGTDDSKIRTLVRRHLMDHLRAASDDYFVIYTDSNNQIKIFDTGSVNNAIQVPKIPNIRRVELSTYGAAGTAGTYRLALKVNFTK